MYWIVEYIQENNLEKREWGKIINEAWNQYIKEITKRNKDILKKEKEKTEQEWAN